MARQSGINGRVARASWQGRDTGCGKSPAAGLVGGCSGPVGNLKNFEHESCRKFENLQLLF
jgi:hypothetical protein